MISIPSMLSTGELHLYRDSTDEQIVYTDLLQPAPAKGSEATRWVPIPGSLAYLVGEVRFGPGKEEVETVAKLFPQGRLLPMPWESAEVFVWYREKDQAHLVAKGKTSGFGVSNAVFNGTAPLSAMISPISVAAELVCSARLVGARIHGEGNLRSVEQALAKAPFGVNADWQNTVGAVLVSVLSELLDEGRLSLEITLPVVQGKDSALQAEMHAEMHAEMLEVALLEWSHRIQASIAPDLTLGAPASLVSTTHFQQPLALALAWPESNVMLRAVRILKPQGADNSVPRI